MEAKYIELILLILFSVIAYPLAKILIGIANIIDKKIERIFEEKDS